MRILICSVPFSPSIGGIETVSEILASRFVAAGHQVRVVTETPSAVPDEKDYRIIRRPSSLALLAQVKWSEVVLHNNISLRFVWPLMFVKRPWVIAHHMWAVRRDPNWGPTRIGRGWIKLFAMRYATNIAVSKAMAESLTVPATVVPNPYANDLFTSSATARRTRDLVFVGRLTPAKGVSVIIDALAALRSQGEMRQLTIIGGGTEERSLREQVKALNLEKNVDFAGFHRGPELVDLLNQHRIMVAPSVGNEPFGLVVLEAIACGLVPIVSNSGGLPDAVGPCGVVVPKNDSASLAAAISRLNDEALMNSLRKEAQSHLARHTPDKIADEYLAVLAKATR